MAAGGAPSLSLTDPAVIASLFPATHKAQQEAFSVLINAAEAPPGERAEMLSNSVLGKAYLSTSMSGARPPRTKEQEAQDALDNKQAQVTDSWDKMERSRLRDETMERVRDLYNKWDKPTQSKYDTPGERKYPIAADVELGEVKTAVAKLLLQGEVREGHHERIAGVLSELDSWLRAELSNEIDLRALEMEPTAPAAEAAVAEAAASGAAADSSAAPAASDVPIRAVPPTEVPTEESSAQDVMALLAAKESATQQLADRLTGLLQGVKKSTEAAMRTQRSGAGTLATQALGDSPAATDGADGVGSAASTAAAAGPSGAGGGPHGGGRAGDAATAWRLVDVMQAQLEKASRENALLRKKTSGDGAASAQADLEALIASGADPATIAAAKARLADAQADDAFLAQAEVESAQADLEALIASGADPATIAAAKARVADAQVQADPATAQARGPPVARAEFESMKASLEAELKTARAQATEGMEVSEKAAESSRRMLSAEKKADNLQKRASDAEGEVSALKKRMVEMSAQLEELQGVREDAADMRSELTKLRERKDVWEVQQSAGSVAAADTASAQAEVESAQAELEALIASGADPATIAAAKARVADAQVQADPATAQARAAAKERHAQAQAVASEHAAEASKAHAELEALIASGADPATIAAAKARVADAQAKADAAQSEAAAAGQAAATVGAMNPAAARAEALDQREAALAAREAELEALAAQLEHARQDGEGREYDRRDGDADDGSPRPSRGRGSRGGSPGGKVKGDPLMAAAQRTAKYAPTPPGTSGAGGVSSSPNERMSVAREIQAVRDECAAELARELAAARRGLEKELAERTAAKEEAAVLKAAVEVAAAKEDAARGAAVQVEAAMGEAKKKASAGAAKASEAAVKQLEWALEVAGVAAPPGTAAILEEALAAALEAAAVDGMAEVTKLTNTYKIALLRLMKEAKAVRAECADAKADALGQVYTAEFEARALATQIANAVHRSHGITHARESTMRVAKDELLDHAKRSDGKHKTEARRVEERMNSNLATAMVDAVRQPTPQPTEAPYERLYTPEPVSAADILSRGVGSSRSSRAASRGASRGASRHGQTAQILVIGEGGEEGGEGGEGGEGVLGFGNPELLAESGAAQGGRGPGRRGAGGEEAEGGDGEVDAEGNARGAGLERLDRAAHAKLLGAQAQVEALEKQLVALEINHKADKASWKEAMARADREARALSEQLAEAKAAEEGARTRAVEAYANEARARMATNKMLAVEIRAVDDARSLIAPRDVASGPGVVMESHDPRVVIGVLRDTLGDADDDLSAQGGELVRQMYERDRNALGWANAEDARLAAIASQREAEERAAEFERKAAHWEDRYQSFLSENANLLLGQGRDVSAPGAASPPASPSPRTWRSRPKERAPARPSTPEGDDGEGDGDADGDLPQIGLSRYDGVRLEDSTARFLDRSLRAQMAPSTTLAARVNVKSRTSPAHLHMPALPPLETVETLRELQAPLEMRYERSFLEQYVEQSMQRRTKRARDGRHAARSGMSASAVASAAAWAGETPMTIDAALENAMPTVASPRAYRGSGGTATAGVSPSNLPGSHLVPRPPPRVRVGTTQSLRTRWDHRDASPVSPPMRSDSNVTRGLALPHVVAPDDLDQRASTVPAPSSAPARPLSPFFKPAATMAHSTAQTRRGEGGPQLEGQSVRHAVMTPGSGSGRFVHPQDHRMASLSAR